MSVAASILGGMDNTSLTQVGHPVVAVLDVVGEALDTGTADVWSLSDDDLAATIARCEVLAARQAALALRLLREADGRDLGRRLGGRCRPRRPRWPRVRCRSTTPG